MLANQIQIRKVEVNVKINNKFTSRHIQPPKAIEISERFLKYKNAQKLADDIEINEKSRHFVIIDGTFIFGDFIEAIILKNNWLVKEMTISTLSMSQNNIDSLDLLIEKKYLEKLNLIVSDYFFQHEKFGLVPYIYDVLDVGNNFQFAAAGTHCKLCIFVTECGKHICIHGSANLRSSSNIEQFVIEESKDLYDFNYEYQKNIIEKYKTINHKIENKNKKSLRRNSLWQAVQENTSHITQQ